MSKFKKAVDNESTEDYQEIDLLKLLKAFWHRAWLIVLAAVVCGGAGFAYARMFIKPTYQASAKMYVNNGSLSLGGTTFSVGDFAASKNLVETYIVLIKTRMMLNEVIERAQLKMSYESLAGKVSATSVNDTEIFSINVTDTDPERATLIANTIAEILPQKVEAIMNRSSMKIVDLAVVPGSRAAPNITKYATLGAIVGILAVCAVIVLLELLDDRIHDEQYLIQNYSLPVLATIPELNSGRGGGYYGKSRGYGYGYGYRSYRSYYAKATSKYAQSSYAQAASDQSGVNQEGAPQISAKEDK